jgi:hypothetical protein
VQLEWREYYLASLPLMKLFNLEASNLGAAVAKDRVKREKEADRRLSMGVARNVSQTFCSLQKQKLTADPGTMAAFRQAPTAVTCNRWSWAALLCGALLPVPVCAERRRCGGR